MFVLGGGLATDPDLYLPRSRWFRQLLYAPTCAPPGARSQLGELSAIGAALPAVH
jgi:hypothetical protein